MVSIVAGIRADMRWKLPLLIPLSVAGNVANARSTGPWPVRLASTDGVDC